MRHLLFFSLLLLSSLTNAQTTKKVCFIGNSYTASNNLPNIIRNLALSDGNELQDTAITPGGSTFEYHSTFANSLGAISAREWDYVVLQEQSQRPSFPWVQVHEEVFPFAEILCDSIRSANPCAVPVFFNTWGRRDGDAMWDSINTFEKMNQRLHIAYDYMADEFSGKLSPVGIGFEHVANDADPPVTHSELYSGDGSHPSIYGSYLAACVFYEILFETDVTGNGFISGGISTEEGLYLQDVAHHVNYEVDSITTAYLDPEASFVASYSGYTATFTNTSLHAFEFEWDFGDGSVSVEENPVHVYTDAGPYIVTLVAKYCGLESVYSDETVVLTVSDDIEEQLKFYPNPSSGIVNLSAVDAPINLSIIGIDGKLVRRFWHHYKEEIELESGFYLIYSGEVLIGKLLVR